MGAAIGGCGLNTVRYANALLNDLGCDAVVKKGESDHPALSWAASGLMEVTGTAAGPGLMCPVPVASAADGALYALAALAPAGAVGRLRGAVLLGQRARLMRLRRAGPVSPGGASYLLQARDGWLAVTLARAEDWNCVPAWLQQDNEGTWLSVARAVRERCAGELVARGRELGLAVARADAPLKASRWFETQLLGEVVKPRNRRPVVLDLSTLWAGPLCGALLARAGAMVIKVESTSRPDGARFGHGGFFDFLNGGKASVALDFKHPDGISVLRQMLACADIVIESARPRALRQLGVSAESMVAQKPGLTWVSITGHGRRAPMEDWVGFGDDAAAAGGFAHAMHAAHGQMMFCGDALADPLTGLHAAAAAYATWRQGGGRLVSLSLSGVAAHCVSSTNGEDLTAQAREWTQIVQRQEPRLAGLPPKPGPARPLGADTRSVAAELGVSC